jgi:hypothetical protein
MPLAGEGLAQQIQNEIFVVHNKDVLQSRLRVRWRRSPRASPTGSEPSGFSRFARWLNGPARPIHPRVLRLIGFLA